MEPCPVIKALRKSLERQRRLLRARAREVLQSAAVGGHEASNALGCLKELGAVTSIDEAVDALVDGATRQVWAEGVDSAAAEQLVQASAGGPQALRKRIDQCLASLRSEHALARGESWDGPKAVPEGRPGMSQWVARLQKQTAARESVGGALAYHSQSLGLLTSVLGDHSMEAYLAGGLLLAWL